MDIDKLHVILAKHGASSSSALTPLSLAREMVSMIFVDWANPNLRVLDPCCGQGTFLFAAYERLLKAGHTPQHIVENMLYGVDINRVAILATRKAFKLLTGFDLKHSYIEDSLKKDWSDMKKFDVVIGNPPYQASQRSADKKLWPIFVGKSFEFVVENGLVALVTPISWIKGFKNTRRLLQSKNVFCMELDANQHFNVGIDIGYFIATNSEYQGSTTINGDTYDISDDDNLVFTYEEEIVKNICDKVLNYSSKLPIRFDNGFLNTQTHEETGIFSVLHSGGKILRTNNQPEGMDTLKVVLPFSATYTSMFITTKPTGMLNACYYAKSNEDAEQVTAFLKSKIMVLVASKWMRTSGFTPLIKKKQLPDLRRVAIWTDAELYAHFNLTEEEIAYIEANVK